MAKFFYIGVFIFLSVNSSAQTKLTVSPLSAEYFERNEHGIDYFGYEIRDGKLYISYDASVKGFYYIVNKTKKETRKNYRLKSISFYKISSLSKYKYDYYGLTSIDIYTKKDNRYIYGHTLFVFKINKNTKEFVGLSEKNFRSDYISSNFEKLKYQ